MNTRKLKTAELIGAALDWAVAKCKGITSIDKRGGVWVPVPKEPHFNEEYSPSTNWSQGGPIIEREKIGSLHEARGVWSASTKWEDPAKVFYGKTKLIAAMRCYVASKLGDEVEMPDQLMGVNNANPTPT